MNLLRSERLLSKHRHKSTKSASASLFSNFNISSLVPSVDLDLSNDAHFGHLLIRSSEKSRRGSVKYAPSDLEQSDLGGPRNDVSGSHEVRIGASALKMSLSPATVSLSNIYGSKSKSGRIEDEIIRTGHMYCKPDGNRSVDIPRASTSGRVDGELWNEKLRGVNLFSRGVIGVLYNFSGEERFTNYWDLPQGKNLEEKVRIDENHSVTTSFEQWKKSNERTVFLSTSHKLGVKHDLATQYTNDLQGGNTFTVNTTHNFMPDCSLSTNSYTNSFGDYSVEVELQREKKRGNHEVLESIMANLRTGDRLLKLQSRNVKKEIVFMNSFISNLRGQHAIKFMATLPLWRSGFVSSSIGTDLHGSQKFCMNAVQKIHDGLVVGASWTTNVEEQDSISMEAKCQVDGLGNLVLKLTNDLRCSRRVDLTSSLTTKKNCCLWAYRNKPDDGQSLELEWRHEVSPEHLFSIRAAAKHWGCALFTEIYLQC